MERKNMVVDVSPFLLIEATGDSEEVNSDLAITRDPGLTSGTAYDGSDGGGNYEDVESCSSGWSSNKSYNNPDVRDLDCSVTEAHDGADESDWWRWTHETGKNERVEQRRWPEAKEPCVSEEINSFDDEEISKKPSGIVSSEVHLSEIEKSRLFWEACLAS